MDKLCFESVK